jgi:hypothetical protein
MALRFALRKKRRREMLSDINLLKKRDVRKGQVAKPRNIIEKFFIN